MAACDLHVHSVYSDGTLTPSELIRLAETLGLSAVALCDHNTVAGLPEFLAAAEGTTVEAVPGIEFSTEYFGKELHLLGLFLEPSHYPVVEAALVEMLRRKEASNIDLVEKLRAAGLDLDYAAIKAGTPGGQVNRAVIGAEMVRKGISASVSEAVSQWLSPKRGYYVPPRRLDTLEIIRMLRSLGAVSVLAHPFLNLDEAGLRAFLREAVPCGLDGMEVLYPKFSPEQRKLAWKIAEEYGLCPSGGSDFHGANKPDIRLGSGRGDLHVPPELLSGLKKQKNREFSDK